MIVSKAKFLVVEFNNLFKFLFNGADRDDFNLKFDIRLLSEDDFYNEYAFAMKFVDCEKFYLIMRCLIYRKCDELYTCDTGE